MNVRKWAFPFLSILLAALLLFPFTSAFAENLLRNPDFRSLDEEGFPEDWYTDAYIVEPGYTVFSVTEGDSAHSIAARIQNIGENDARFAQTVEVEPDSLYLLSGYIRAEGVSGGQGANLSVEGVYAFSEKVYDSEGEWKYIEYYGETGPDQDFLTVFARLGGYSGICTGKAWFADLSLTKVDSIPGDGIADLWYREQTGYIGDDEAEDDESDLPGAAWPRLLLIALAYSLAAAVLLYREQKRPLTPGVQESVHPGAVWCALGAAMLLRLVLCWFVEGYMVDVNCFLSWGHTMASVGPVRFYEATNFCDYPPLYTYVLALNSLVSGLLGGSAEVSRVVFRFVPCLCDLAGCLLLYRLMTRQEQMRPRSCFLFLLFAAFNPTMILNSAAWGQMDSVLCLLLLAVALLSLQGRWKAVLPLYVVAVLVKPQALMLGPLGLAYLILSWIRTPGSRKELLQGIAAGIIVLAACVIPFSLQQNPDWLISLYGKTLASYPYATVNTANFWYLLGGNWSAVGNAAPRMAPALLALFCTGYGCWWYLRAKNQPLRSAETLISLGFAAGFVLCVFVRASWAWTGGLAMAYAFVIILSPAVRTGNIRLLPWLGGLLFILLYVFGVKMHERYLFPALLLLASAWILIRDRRILYILILFSVTVFINEGIVLDNSIRLGSSLGHLNSDTVWLADLISLMNVIGAFYAVWLSTELFLPRNPSKAAERQPCDRLKTEFNRKLHWTRKDTAILAAITAVYTVISLLTLGSTKAPQTGWSSSSAEEQIIFDLGEQRESFEMLYFAQVSRYDFTVSVSDDGQTWEEETWAQMDQGQCWKWKYVTESYVSDTDGNGNGKRLYYDTKPEHIIRFSGRYVRLTAMQLGLKLNEVLFRDEEGNVLPVTVCGTDGAVLDSELYSDPSALIDEQDTMEALPSILAGAHDTAMKIEPSWWNSTYFDEIYHARTAYEFLQGTVPYETTHPPLGKVLISAFVAVFGMTPFGWRFAGALAGILMLPGMYLLGKQLTRKTWAGVFACLMMALDCLHLTQTQIATIDSFPVLFILFAYFFMLRFVQTDFLREKLSVSLVSLGLSGLFMGLSIASKWIGIYAGAGLAVLYFWHCIRMIRIQKQAVRRMREGSLSGPESEEIRQWIPGESGASDALNRTMTLCAWCILFFILIPAAIYLLSYIPYMAYNARRIQSLSDYIREVWRAQVGMFDYHSTPNLGMDHPFYSPWWEWPVIGKPMYYASQHYLTDASPFHHSIFCFGNPVIWFGALAAFAVCAVRSALRRRYRITGDEYLWHLSPVSTDTRSLFIIIGLMAQYLPWVLVPRGTYIYHYFASLPFLMLAIVLCAELLRKHNAVYAKVFTIVFTLAAAVFFILLFPYASGMNVSAAWLDIGKKLLRIWY